MKTAMGRSSVAVFLIYPNRWRQTTRAIGESNTVLCLSSRQLQAQRMSGRCIKG